MVIFIFGYELHKRFRQWTDSSNRELTLKVTRNIKFRKQRNQTSLESMRVSGKVIAYNYHDRKNQREKAISILCLNMRDHFSNNFASGKYQ